MAKNQLIIYFDDYPPIVAKSLFHKYISNTLQMPNLKINYSQFKIKDAKKNRLPNAP